MLHLYLRRLSTAEFVAMVQKNDFFNDAKILRKVNKQTNRIKIEVDENETYGRNERKTFAFFPIFDVYIYSIYNIDY